MPKLTIVVAACVCVLIVMAALRETAAVRDAVVADQVAAITNAREYERRVRLGVWLHDATPLEHAVKTDDVDAVLALVNSGQMTFKRTRSWFELQLNAPSETMRTLVKDIDHVRWLTVFLNPPHTCAPGASVCFGGEWNVVSGSHYATASREEIIAEHRRKHTRLGLAPGILDLP